jgi:hypothetical protein
MPPERAFWDDHAGVPPATVQERPRLIPVLQDIRARVSKDLLQLQAHEATRTGQPRPEARNIDAPRSIRLRKAQASQVQASQVQSAAVLGV